MKILVNVFHPDLPSSSINSAWVSELSRAGKTTVNLMYSHYPNWEIDVEREHALLLEHERVIFQHPFYWYSAPPLMKKWMDDVLTFNWAFGPEGNALKGKEWISAISTGVKAEEYQAGGAHHYSMSELLKPYQQTANLCGMNYLAPYTFHDAMQASDVKINQSAKKYLLHINDATLATGFTLPSVHSDECEVCAMLKD